MAPSVTQGQPWRGGRARLGWTMALLVLGWSVAALAATDQPTPGGCPGPGQPVALHSIARGVIGQLKEPGEAVIRTEADWTALWERLALPFTPTLPAPQVEFASQMILAVYAGEGRGVLETEITRVERRGACLVAMVAERRPPASVPSGQFLVFHPFHLVRVDAGPEAVVFRQVRTVRVKAERAVVWQAMEAAMRARGEAVDAADQPGGVLTTGPTPLPRTRLTEVVRLGAESDWQEGRYRLELRLEPREGPEVQVEVGMELECLGRPDGRLGAPVGWWPCPSNGAIEAEVLQALTGQMASRERREP